MFADKLPLCTEPGCAHVPESKEEYKGLVKPGKLLHCISGPAHMPSCSREQFPTDILVVFVVVQ